MSTSYWLSYDGRYDRRPPRRKWPWVLLLIALLLVVLSTALAFAGDEADLIDLTEPVAIEQALPALLTDNVTVIYVVDDSGSMWEKLLPLHEALHEVSGKHTENSEIAMLKFGQHHEMLFDFSEPSEASWNNAIPSFTAGSGNTHMYTALKEAFAMMPDQPNCWDKTRWLFWKETICRERRIVLMSDGIASDPHLSSDVMPELVLSGIPVDTIAFGEDADRFGLKKLSDATGGRFVTAY